VPVVLDAGLCTSASSDGLSVATVTVEAWINANLFDFLVDETLLVAFAATGSVASDEVEVRCNVDPVLLHVMMYRLASSGVGNTSHSAPG